MNAIQSTARYKTSELLVSSRWVCNHDGYHFDTGDYIQKKSHLEVDHVTTNGWRNTDNVTFHMVTLHYEEDSHQLNPPAPLAAAP
mmetsp:Transcript_23281/g.46425  ORF Transcript_23281/g.46425 Transcript_23281/m.46425 type:complete len:85 (-) Transcript_23281:970-1224(-)